MLRGVPRDQQTDIAGQLQFQLGHLLADPSIAAGLAEDRTLKTLRIAEPLRMRSVRQDPIGIQAASSIVGGLRR